MNIQARRLLRVSAAISFCVWLLSALSASAQEREIIEMNHYKIKGGLKSEWLELYKKNHLPILQDHQKAGLIQDIKIFEISSHQLEPDLDYLVMIHLKNWSARDAMEKREDEVRQRLYPAKEKFEQEENRRWEITVKHWDTAIRPVKP